MDVVEADEHLTAKVADNRDGDALVVISLDEGQEVVTEDLKHHADVAAVGAHVLKVVSEAAAVFFVLGVVVSDLREERDLVPRGLRVVFLALLDLHGPVEPCLGINH